MKKKYFLFTTIFIISSTFLLLLLLLGADLFLHKRLEKQQGYNYRGYRGKVLGSKQPGEYRIACFGASVVYGYFIKVEETWPFLLEEELRPENKNITVANLGLNVQGVYGISHDIKYYEYLNYDMAIIYDSYIDSSPSGVTKANGRGGNFIFEYFGYMPILPTYLSEKSKILKHGINKLNDAYLGNVDSAKSKIDRPIQFRIGMALDEMNSVFTTMNEKLIKYDKEANTMIENNEKPFSEYLYYLEQILNWSKERDIKIIFVGGHGGGGITSLKQQLVIDLINKKYSKNVRYLNIANAIDASNRELALDGMHFSKKGNQIIANKIRDFLKTDSVIKPKIISQVKY